MQGTLQDHFPGLSGFGFFRKLVRTKNKQGIDKAIKHNGLSV